MPEMEAHTRTILAAQGVEDAYLDELLNKEVELEQRSKDQMAEAIHDTALHTGADDRAY